MSSLQNFSWLPILDDKRYDADEVTQSLASIALIIPAIVILVTFPGWQSVQADEDGSMHEVKPFPSKQRLQGISALLSFSMAFALISALWLHVGAVATAEILENTFDGLVRAAVGSAIVAFIWLTVFLISVALLAMFIMQYSVMLLDRLTDDLD